MKIIKITSLIMAGALALIACGGDASKSVDKIDMPQGQVDSVSYAIGVHLGMMVKQSNFGDLNLGELNRALKDVLTGDESDTLEITPEQTGMIIQQYAMARIAKLGELNKQEGIDFLAENKTKEGIDTTASGLQYKIIEAGSELKPNVSDVVIANYKGTLLDGTEFDARDAQEFPLLGVIAGWTEGLQLIGEGGKIILYVPSELGYGPQGPGIIGPNAALIFEVELVKVIKANTTEE